MKTKIITLILALVAIATAQAQSVVVNVERDGVAYRLWSDHTASIPYRAEHCSLTGTLTLHQTITHNGQNYTLTKIENAAFSNAYNLEGTLTIPSTVTYIGSKAFYVCSFKGELIIPNSVVTIDEEAFAGNFFSSLIVGDGVTSIGHMAFFNHNISSVVLGANVQTIGNTAFGKNFTSTQDLQVECRSSLPPTLGTNVFENCTVTQVTVPPCAFDDYQASTDWSGFNLYEKRINVQIDGVYYVLHCSSNTATVTHAGYDELNNETYWNSYSGAVTIPATVTHEGKTYAVTLIGAYAFRMCTSLANITIGDNVQTIGNSAFEDCTSLKQVTIGDNVQTIGNSAFRDCTSLETVTIGDNVREIGDYAFRSCTAIASITSKNPTPPTLGSNAFNGVPTSAVLNVPCAATEDYATAEQWQNFNIQGIPEIHNAQIDGVYYVLEGCALTATVTHKGYTEKNSSSNWDSYSGVVTIPATVTHEGKTYAVTRIGAYAFFGCTSLEQVTIGDNVQTIGDNAFYNCSSLTRVTIGDNVQTIGKAAFRDCTSLDSLTLGDNVQTIGGYAFYKCSSLTSVTIGDNVQTIGSSAFRDCTSLKQVTIGDNVKTIGDHAFRDCTSLEQVTIGDNVKTIGAYAFQNCTSLDSLILGDNVQEIGSQAFHKCTSLGTVVLGKGLKNIGSNAFNDCTALTSITSLNPVPPTLGMNAFYGVPTTAVLYVPCSARADYAAATGWKEFKNIDCAPLVLLDDDSEATQKNHELIRANLGEQVGKVNVTIEGRTLYKTGHWNTLMLPFSLASFAGTPLEDADVRELVPDECAYANGTLTLKFAAVSAIEANKPYIVRWAASEENIDDPQFANVFLEDGIRVIDLFEGGILFFGTYDSFAVPELELKHYLYMGSDSKLYYPLAPMNINAFCTFFILRDFVAGESSATDNEKEIRNIVLDFGNGETTGIDAALKDNEPQSNDYYYSIDGQRLQGKPTKKGIYIKNGKKVVLK